MSLMNKYVVKEDVTKTNYARKSEEEVETRPKFTFKNNGATYTGQWLKNQSEVRHGYGVQLWADGARYEGHWKYNKANG